MTTPTCNDLLKILVGTELARTWRDDVSDIWTKMNELAIINGAASVAGYTLKESFTTVTNNVFTVPNSEKRYGFEIWNQGSSNLTFTINSITITVAPNATYSNEFDAFTTVTLSANAVFEAHTLGVRS